MQWIVAGYSLAFGLALVPGGSLGDLHGRKRLFLAGVAVFLLAGVAAATGGGPGTVIGARLVQGAAAGLVNSQVIGTIQDVFRGVDRGRALGLYAVTSGVATALGPPLGGALVAGLGPAVGWRYCLLLSAPCAVTTLVLAARWLPPPRPTARDARLDVLGLALACGCTLTLMVPFIRTPDSGGEAGLWAAGVCALACAFTAQQRLRARRGRGPLVHPALRSSKPYMLGTAVAMAQFGSSLAASLVLTVFLQDGLGLSALLTAAVALPSALAMGVSSALAWRVVRRIGPRTVSVGLTLGIFAALAGAVAALLVPHAGLPLAFAATQLLSGAVRARRVAQPDTGAPARPGRGRRSRRRHSADGPAHRGGGLPQRRLCGLSAHGHRLPSGRLRAGLLRLRGPAGRSPGAVASAAGGHLVTCVGVRVRGGPSRC